MRVLRSRIACFFFKAVSHTSLTLLPSLAPCLIWSAICLKIMTRFTCGFFSRILAIIPATRYTCVFLPAILAFFLTNAHIYALQKKNVVYGVTESRRIRCTELYRQQKTPSCTMRLKSNFSMNQASPQWPG